MLAAERHQLFAGVEGRWDVPSQDMDDPREPQRMPYSGQVLEITREVDRAARALDGLVGIAEHPQRNPGLPIGAHARVVAAIQPGMIAVHVAIVKHEALAHVFLGCLLYTSPSPRDRQKS